MSVDHVAACLAAAAAWCLMATPRALIRSRRRSSSAALVVGVSVGLVWLAGAARLSMPLALIAIGVGLALWREVRRRRERREAVRRRDAAIAACAGLVAELQAGLPPTRALVAVAEDWSEFRPVADAAVLGADVPSALRRLAELPGGGALRWIGAAWTVAHRSGAGLAGAVGLAVDAMTEERATARVLETELASARATARLLALLPFGVLLIGSGVGGNPFGFLFGTLAGTGCLVVGLSLAWVGLVWIERIAAGVTQA